MVTSGINGRKQRAIAAILAYPTLLQAAKASGIPYRTLWRWASEDKPFKDALAEAEKHILEEAMRRLLNLQGQAVDTLRDIMTDPQARQSDKLRAVELALGYALRMRNAVFVEDRLNQLEQKIFSLLIVAGDERQLK